MHGGAVLDYAENVSVGQRQWREFYVAHGEQKRAQIEKMIRFADTNQASRQAHETLPGQLSEIRYEFHPHVPIDQHPQKVCDLGLDIGIAPIVGDRFNENKSCIKYYEYAVSGAVTVVSKVLPYSTEVPITAKNNRDSWIAQLEWALNVDRKALWREQWEWVMTHRNIQTNVALWEQAFSGRALTNDSVVQQTSLGTLPAQRG